jgi:glycosyltransferase involved in cell wall biosynthesis
MALSLRLKDRITDRVVVGALENIEAFRREAGRNTNKMRVIHTGIELQRFQLGQWRDEVRAELGYGPGEVVAGTVARLDDERKGIRDFLRAAALVSGEVSDSRFLIVGEGVLRPAYESLTRDLGIDNKVKFAGWRSDVPRLLDAMDVFAMSSTHEGGPTSLLEAMAMAKPSVSTSVGMAPEVIEHGRSGLVIPPGDVAAMAAALGSLLSANEGLRRQMGSQARARALASLGIERMADEYVELFLEALSRPGLARIPSPVSGSATT